MIQLTRERTTQRVPTRFRGTGRLTSERNLLTLRAAGNELDAGVWKAAKNQLKRESGGKCAYCEGKASHVAHGDVEHFRPKSDYWWLGYCYDNYTYACQICNQTYKGANFPIDGPHLVAPALPSPALPADIEALVGTLGVDPLVEADVDAFQALLAPEQAQLPDPYLVDPEPLFSWFADDVIKEVEIRPRDQSSAALTAFAAADEFLGLNRQELKAWRWEVYDIARVLTQVLKAQPPVSAQLRTNVERVLLDMMATTGEFAGMVRYLVRDVEGLPL